MKRWILAFIACTALALVASPSRAQIPVPTPSPDPHQYSDPGMTFVAPPEALLIGRREVEIDQLGEDLAPVAIWAISPGKEYTRAVEVEMEAFKGPPNEWEAQFESQMHSATTGLLVKNRTPMSLTNGMPATFVEMTFGEGFDSKKMYAVVFADGLRGIVLAEVGRVGELGADEAKRVLHDAKAVRYPIDQP